MLGDLLGRGGMAEVFSGYVIGSHGFQKPVAIKRLLPELANDDVFVDRLIGEAKLLVGMQHGNIVSVLDLARDGNDVFLVMEYVDGPSLRQLIKGRGSRRLSLGTASYIVQSAAQGLEFAHARPGGAIIHADISPSNLLLTTSGEVRVADFGIARREGNGAGVVEGKWAYMAPEQARGEPLTPRSDVFALGVVLYELITGQHPLGRQISAEERDSGPIRVVPPRIVNPAVPPGLDAICMKALAENARDRYARMQQLIDAIMDERFTNQWREGANDLATAIREITPGAVGAGSNGPRTQVTDRPVTIVTRSLISHTAKTPKPVTVTYELDDQTTEESYNNEATGLAAAPTVARGSLPLIPPSGAQTMLIEMPAPRASAPIAVPYRMSSPLMAMEHAEMASVHGGATVTGSHAIDVRDARSNKWTIAVLAVAAAIGVIAAIGIQLAPSDSADHAEAAANTQLPAERVADVAPAPALPIERPPTALPQPTVPVAVVEAPAVQAIVDTRVVAEPERDEAPAPAPVVRKARTAPSKRTASSEKSWLRVSTYEGIWAYVYVGNQKKEIPNANFELAPGSYRVKLTNKDLGTTHFCPITLQPGDVKRIKVDMEEGGCEQLR